MALIFFEWRRTGLAVDLKEEGNFRVPALNTNSVGLGELVVERSLQVAEQRIF